MISVPALLLLGFSPQSAVAINQVGDIGAFVSATRQYWRSQKIDWAIAIPLAIITIICSILGAQIMVRMPTHFLQTFIGLTILAFLPFFFLGKNIGLKPRRTSKLSKAIGFSLYALIAVQGAIVGAGGATVILIIMMYFFGYEIIRGYATNTPAEIFSAVIPAVVYAFYGFIKVWPAIIIFLGMLIGGFIGANTALQKGSKWVKNLLTLVIVMLVVKILFF